MKDTTLRSRLAHSEAAAAGLLARSMRDQGNDQVRAEPLSAGLLVSLGLQRYVNRLLCTELDLDEDDIVRTVDILSSRGLPPSIQISSTADVAISDLLRGYGFEVDWRRSVLAGRADETAGSAMAANVSIQMVGHDDLDDWLLVLAKGNNAESGPARTTSDEYGRAADGIAGAVDLLARVDGRAASCGSLQPIHGVAWLGGAATVPEFRRQGLQQAMLGRRIAIAARDGHDYVAATAVPDSSSIRNLERAGLRLVDNQTVWTRQL